MSQRKTLSRLTVASLATAALAAPAATAMPIDRSGRAVHTQAALEDRRAEVAADPSVFTRPAGPPSWTADVNPVARAQAQLAGAGDDGGGSNDSLVLVLVVAGALALGGGMAATAMRVNPHVAR
jgi:hypothetical protein